MKTQKTNRRMTTAIYSSLLDRTLARIITTVMFILPTVVYSQRPEWTVYNSANSELPYNGVTSLAIDAQGNIWIGTGIFGGYTGGGLAMFDGENWMIYNTSNSKLPHNDLPVLNIDSQGSLWIGTDGGGLARFDGINWTVYNASNSGMPDNRVYGLPFDTVGNLWISTFGLAKFDGINWMVYNTSNSGLPSNLTTCAVIDLEDNVWIGTWDGGIVKFDGIRWTVYNTSNSRLPNNTIWDLTFDIQGNLWVGTNGGGAAMFDGTNWRVYNTSNSKLPTNTVHRFSIDSQGYIWMGTDSGLAIFDGENWRIYNTSNSGLPDNDIWCIAFDGHENIWIGTGRGGLAMFHPKPVIDFNGDGTVDIKDLLRLIESWEQGDPAVDMAPLPFGDGIVDSLDLELLMSCWEQPVDDPTLLAHWALDEVEGIIAYDSAGVNDAFVIGGAEWQPNAGQVNGALELNGVDGCAIANQVINPADGPFSVFAWIKGGAPGQVSVSQQGATNWLGSDPDLGCVMTELMPPSVGRFAPQPLKSEFVITDGEWHRIGFVWDGANRALYVDNILVAEDAQKNLYSSFGGLNIGCGSNSAAETYWCGLIDDVRVYNRAVKP